MDVLEYGECCLFADYLDDLREKKKILRFTHVPNSTWTISWGQKVRNKQQGLRPGFPDYIILMSNGILFIEMKRTKKGVTSPEQKQWISDLEKAGFQAFVCKGFDEAKEVVQRYL